MAGVGVQAVMPIIGHDNPSGASEDIFLVEPHRSVPVVYWLSPRAARGIVRRVEERGRKVDPDLMAALRKVAE